MPFFYGFAKTLKFAFKWAIHIAQRQFPPPPPPLFFMQYLCSQYRVLIVFLIYVVNSYGTLLVEERGFGLI